MLRNFIPSDLTQIITIENAVQIDPWSYDIFQSCLKAGCLTWVIEEDKKILGFIMISLNHKECHIYNLAVAKSHQHQGLGQTLMEKALDYAKENGANFIYLEVRETNTRAVALYKSLGFELIGTRKDYYSNLKGYEDALVLVKSL